MGSFGFIAVPPSAETVLERNGTESDGIPRNGKGIRFLVMDPLSNPITMKVTPQGLILEGVEDLPKVQLLSNGPWDWYNEWSVTPVESSTSLTLAYNSQVGIPSLASVQKST